MRLTPIKVPGKRRRKDGDEPASVRASKRPTGERKNKPKKARAPGASFLERELPLEVLERIFWLSENVNLPRASPLVGRLLSGPSTLRKTFLNAFAPTWDVWYGCVRNRVQSYYDWDRSHACFGGDPEFQSSVLECRWANIALILDCWDIWVRVHGKNRHFEHIQIWGKACDDTEPTDTDTLVETSDSTQGARKYFLRDYDAFRQVEMFNQSELMAMNRQDHDERHLVTWMDVHLATRIPDCLLTGPWDEAALQKLFWLVRAGARLSRGQTWELTLEGFHNALADYPPNLTVIRLFEMLGAFQAWPGHVLNEEYYDLSKILRPLEFGVESYHKRGYIQILLASV